MGNAVQDGDILGCERGEAVFSRGGDQVCDAWIRRKGRGGSGGEAQALACAVVVGAVQLYHVQRELGEGRIETGHRRSKKKQW